MGAALSVQLHHRTMRGFIERLEHEELGARLERRIEILIGDAQLRQCL
jgi:hypothetical protein